MTIGATLAEAIAPAPPPRRARRDDRAATSSSELLDLVTLERCARRPLSERAQRRPAAARRAIARALAGKPAAADPRRGDLGARRLGPGGDPQPAARPARVARAHLRLHLARPVGDRLPVRARDGAVPRPGGRGGELGGAVRRRLAIRTRARCSTRSRRCTATSIAGAGRRRRAGPAPAAAGLPLPHALPASARSPIPSGRVCTAEDPHAAAMRDRGPGTFACHFPLAAGAASAAAACRRRRSPLGGASAPARTRRRRSRSARRRAGLRPGPSRSRAGGRRTPPRAPWRTPRTASRSVMNALILHDVGHVGAERLAASVRCWRTSRAPRPPCRRRRPSPSSPKPTLPDTWIVRPGPDVVTTASLKPHGRVRGEAIDAQGELLPLAAGTIANRSIGMPTIRCDQARLARRDAAVPAASRVRGDAPILISHDRYPKTARLSTVTIEAAYAARTPPRGGSMERAARSMPRGLTRSLSWFAPYPVVFERGAGAILTDVDGNEYVDLFGNGLSLIHGHAPPADHERADAPRSQRGTRVARRLRRADRVRRAALRAHPRRRAGALRQHRHRGDDARRQARARRHRTGR